VLNLKSSFCIAACPADAYIAFIKMKKNKPIVGLAGTRIWIKDDDKASMPVLPAGLQNSDHTGFVFFVFVFFRPARSHGVF
jgi:hypothetical protein